eukprot:TRINITY_DN7252_c0_g1_i2.p1 TRINITY_DN7252_c0_g1~~TRINITY_DN7252_c0_g1_i2.p1  ORF type:complete len:370 (-),score=76.27 TRINITY_DN7252_c0_g1_i2:139-1248(-)
MSGEVVKNQHFDEAIELSGSDADQSFNSGLEGLSQRGHERGSSGLGDGGLGPARPESALSGGGFSSDGSSPRSNFGATGNTGLGDTSDNFGSTQSPRPGGGSMGGPDDSGEHSLDESREALPAGAYNPDDYKHLQVSSEVSELFAKITHYKPLDIELPTNIDPFVPEFIPAVGDLDAFITVPRPDGRTDDVGVKVLREANPTQTDATVLKHRLRATTKQSNLEAVPVKAVSNIDRNPNEMQKWIDSIKEIHDSRPPATVHYTNQMPNIEQLMQVWPAEFEELLDSVKLPPADIDVDLLDYCRMVCAILDIPVHNNIMESLHTLFTLFMEFRSNQYFMGGGAHTSFSGVDAAGNAVSNQYIPNASGLGGY